MSDDYTVQHFNSNVWRIFGAENLIAAARDIVEAEPAETLTDLEQDAADFAAEMCGEYCIAIGKTDFTDMLPQERDEFIRVLIVNFYKDLRRRVLEQPPF